MEDSAWKWYRLQLGTVKERSKATAGIVAGSYIQDAFPQYNGLQCSAILKSAVVNALYRPGNADWLQCGTIVERTCGDDTAAVNNRNVVQRLAAGKQVGSHCGYLAADCCTLQTWTALESILSNRRHGVWYGDGCQARTIVECPNSNSLQSLIQLHFFKGSAACEGIGVHMEDSIREINRLQCNTSCKCSEATACVITATNINKATI